MQPEIVSDHERKTFPHDATARAVMMRVANAERLDAAGLDRFLTIHEVKLLTSLGKTVIYGLMQAGKFPRPIPVAERRVAWSARDIACWQRERRGEALVA